MNSGCNALLDSIIFVHLFLIILLAKREMMYSLFISDIY